MNLQDIIPFAEKYLGSPYIFGVSVPKNDPNYDGKKGFDCAEYVSYCVKQVFGIDYGSRNGDAYTGFFGDDAETKGIIIPVELAKRIPGAFLLRLPVKATNAIGHIAISLGDGRTIEAHSTKKGTIKSIADGRNWDYGVLLPGIALFINDEKPKQAEPKTVFKLKTPMMKDPLIQKVQNGLKTLGYYKDPKTDQFFGNKMHQAIVDFQRKQGLIVDGQFTADGEVVKELTKLKAL